MCCAGAAGKSVNDSSLDWRNIIEEVPGVGRINATNTDAPPCASGLTPRNFMPRRCAPFRTRSAAGRLCRCRMSGWVTLDERLSE